MNTLHKGDNDDDDDDDDDNNNNNNNNKGIYTTMYSSSVIKVYSLNEKVALLYSQGHVYEAQYMSTTPAVYFQFTKFTCTDMRKLQRTFYTKIYVLYTSEFQQTSQHLGVYK
jgi:hypothetical protein